METKSQPTSPNELLIHPGETIYEILQDRNISQKELAIRTGFTEKHISTVINGQKNISPEFAMKLEYALRVPSSFWRNLQTNYDLEVLLFDEKHNISDEEKSIAKQLKPIAETLMGEVVKTNNEIDCVFELRQLLNVSNLKSLVPLSTPQFRIQSVESANELIMYVWQYLCEQKTEGQTDKKLDVEKLKKSLDQIKSVMHKDPSKHVSSIAKILNDCGILFIVENHVGKASIKGLTVKTKKDQLMIALTIRGKFVDIFWFTLFHEIGHVINGHYLKKPNSLEELNKTEKEADEFAADTLIDKELYIEFVSENKFTRKNIELFAAKNNVMPAIVIGRLMNDKFIPWSAFKRETYILNTKTDL